MKEGNRREEWGQNGKVPFCREFYGSYDSMNVFLWGSIPLEPFLCGPFFEINCKISRWQKVMPFKFYLHERKSGVEFWLWLGTFSLLWCCEMSPSLDLDKVVASTLGDCFLGAFIMDVCFFLFIYLFRILYYYYYYFLKSKLKRELNVTCATDNRKKRKNK